MAFDAHPLTPLGSCEPKVIRNSGECGVQWQWIELEGTHDRLLLGNSRLPASQEESKEKDQAVAHGQRRISMNEE
jgi:hypothetical protein